MYHFYWLCFNNQECIRMVSEKVLAERLQDLVLAGCLEQHLGGQGVAPWVTRVPGPCAHSTLPSVAFVMRHRLVAGLHATPQRREVDHTPEGSTTLCRKTRHQPRRCPWLPQRPKGASINPSGKQVHIPPPSGMNKDSESQGERASSTVQGHRNRGVLTEGGQGCHPGKHRPGPAQF